MKDNINLFGDQFIEFIKRNFPNAKSASGKKEIVIRCPYCGDSRDPTHGHMYIHVPSSKDDAPLFHCFKCQVSSILNSSKLIEWGIYDPVMGSQLDSIIKESSKTQKFKGYNSTRYLFYNNIFNQDLADQKIQYIKSRIGVTLTKEECLRQKIILNLKDALDYRPNMITEYSRHPNIVQQLNDNFVGFLSLDNNFVNLRRICDEGIVYESIDKRYINYNIHNKMDNTEKMYVMPANINLALCNRVQIHIAEGAFDILSIRYNLRFNEDGIFAAITGSGYKGLVMHLINAFKLFYFDLHVYPDNDKFGSDKMINDLYNYIHPFGATLYVHRNLSEGEKDFGVTPDRIKEQITIFR